MPDPAGETSRLVDLFRLGDAEAKNRLISHSCERLRNITNRMLRSYPGLLRWEQTDDVLQNSLIRLCKALEATKPESARHFYNLAALQIRRELIDLVRHHLGPHSHGEMHHTDGAAEATGEKGDVLAGKASAMDEPDTLEAWTHFHERVGLLPDEEREVVELLWYEELPQREAAYVLDVSLRTVKRRWQSARLKLAEVLEGIGENL